MANVRACTQLHWCKQPAGAPSVHTGGASRASTRVHRFCHWSFTHSLAHRSHGPVSNRLWPGGWGPRLGSREGPLAAVQQQSRWSSCNNPNWKRTSVPKQSSCLARYITALLHDGGSISAGCGHWVGASHIVPLPLRQGPRRGPSQLPLSGEGLLQPPPKPPNVESVSRGALQQP